MCAENITVLRKNVIKAPGIHASIQVFLFLHGYYVYRKPFVVTFAREELQFSNVVNERTIKNPTDIVSFVSHDWISKRIFWQIEISLVRRHFSDFNQVDGGQKQK